MGGVRLSRVLPLLLLACAGAPDVEDRSTRVETRVLDGSSSNAMMRVTARSVELTLRPLTGEVDVVLDVGIENIGMTKWDGSRDWQRSVAANREHWTLEADGVRVPQSTTGRAGAWPEILSVGAGLNGFGSGAFAWSWPSDHLPTVLTLRHERDHHELVLPLMGHTTSEEGRRALVVPLGRNGRPLVATADVVFEVGDGLLVEANETDGQARLGWLPLDTEQVTVRVTADGHRPWSGSWAFADLPDLVQPVLEAEAEPGDTRALLADQLPLQTPAGDRLGFREVAAALLTAEEAHAWVRDEIAILPTLSKQRSADAVVRMRAGSPHERANLLIAILREHHEQANVACGEPSERARAAMYRDPALPRPRTTPVLDSWVAQVAARAKAGKLDSPPRPPKTALRDRFRVEPEWCWVEHIKADGTLQVLALLPEVVGDEMVAAWRRPQAVGEDIWQLRARLTAVIRSGSPDDPQWEDRVLASFESPVMNFNDRAAVFDLHRGPSGAWQTTLGVVDAITAGVKTHEQLAPDGLEALRLEIDLDDPLRMASSAHSLPLWHREQASRPMSDSWRIVLSADPGSTSLAWVRAVAGAALHQDHPMPGALGSWSEHLLASLVRTAAAPDLVPDRPMVRVTVLDGIGEREAHRRRYLVPAPSPADFGSAGSDANARRLARIEAATVDLIDALPGGLEAGGLQLPTAWTRSIDELGEVGRVSSIAHTAARRMPEGTWFGMGDPAGFWIADHAQGTIARIDLDGGPLAMAAAEPAPPEDSPGSALTAQRRWRLPTLCQATAVWSTLFGGESRPLAACSTNAPAP